MRILFPDIHLTLTKNFAISMQKLGHEVIVPSKEYKPTYYPRPPINHFVWNKSWTQELLDSKINLPNIKVLSKQEILDIKPDIIFVTAFENQEEIIKEIYSKAKAWGAKLVYYSGNDYWDGAYDKQYLKNYLCADKTGLMIAQKLGINYLSYKPYVDFDMFSFAGVSDGNLIGTYIGEYNKIFPQDFIMYLEYQKAVNGARFKFHSKSTKEQTAECMKESIATLHIKHCEGYGYALIEAMGRGRPAFLYKPFAVGKMYEEWAKEGETALYFSSKEEFSEKMGRILNDSDYRHNLQINCAKKIRELIDNDKMNKKLEEFFSKLI